MNRDPDEDNLPNLSLASGRSGGWRVYLDESADGTAWSMQLDGPNVYVAFAPRNPGVVREARDYLRAGSATVGALALGQFGSADVCLHWDTDASRCFLIVGPQAGAAFRVTLSATDAARLAEALDQVLEDLPPDLDHAPRGATPE